VKVQPSKRTLKERPGSFVIPRRAKLGSSSLSTSPWEFGSSCQGVCRSTCTSLLMMPKLDVIGSWRAGDKSRRSHSPASSPLSREVVLVLCELLISLSRKFLASYRFTSYGDACLHPLPRFSHGLTRGLYSCWTTALTITCRAPYQTRRKPFKWFSSTCP